MKIRDLQLQFRVPLRKWLQKKAWGNVMGFWGIVNRKTVHNRTQQLRKHTIQYITRLFAIFQNFDPLFGAQRDLEGLYLKNKFIFVLSDLENVPFDISLDFSRFFKILTPFLELRGACRGCTQKISSYSYSATLKTYYSTYRTSRFVFQIYNSVMCYLKN